MVKVALTFDAEYPGREHQSAYAPGRILLSLAPTAVPATFFLQGRWAVAEPGLARSMAASHEIGNHGYHHVPMTWLSPEYFGREVADAAEAILRVVRRSPLPMFRPPFGAWDPHLNGALEAWGYRLAGWTHDVDDWQPATSANDVEERGLAAITSGADPVVLLLHTWPKPTADALPRLIARAREAGAEFVRMSELAEETWAGRLA